jgi:antitoxin PrlF
MTAMAKLTSKGQVTIPRSVREHLKLDTGSVLVFEVKGDRVIVRAARTLHAVGGILRRRGPRKADFEAMRRAGKAHVTRRVMSRG